MHNTRSKRAKQIAATMMLATLCGGAQAADSYSVSALYGKKYLNDWEPLDSQSEFGLGVTFQPPTWPFIGVVNYLRSKDSGTDTIESLPLKYSGQTAELNFGVRKNLTDEAIKVFAEGGLAYLSAKFKIVETVTGESERDSGSSLGLWLGAGVDVMVNNSISVGGLIRLSKGRYMEPSIGGTHFNLYATYHFQLGVQ